MFLDRLVQRNPGLPLAAAALHQAGSVRANTYLIDLDTLRENARIIRQAADAHALSLYFMSKQFGRNPDACRSLVEAGIPAAVAVDLQGMEALQRSGTPIGHVGHLVQPHRWSEDAAIAAQPEVITVFSVDLAERVGAAASRVGRHQDVLLRVTAAGDRFYFGHGGGFPLSSIDDVAKKVSEIEGVRVVGVTTFPCLLANPSTRTIEPTHNFATLGEAARRLRAAGFDVRQVNAPGTTSSQTMTALREGGATHAEPGNGLLGTTPLHVFDPDAPEVPAIIYVSEVSHLEGRDAYVFAAGMYIDKVLGDYQLTALCGRDKHIVERRYHVDTAPEGAIHYYCIIRLRPNHDVRPGDTVIFCFRPQTFVTRARTQALADVRSNEPAPLGVYDQEARPIDGMS
jgi:predicted amino acid racemase